MEFLSNLYPHGVFLRRDAIAHGVPEKMLYAAVRHGSVVRVRHGAFTDSARWQQANDVARHRLRAHAVALSHRPPVAISHLSGAALHGMRMWNVELGKIHLSRPLETGGNPTSDVAYHLRSVDEAVMIEGSPVTSAAVCAVEAACLVGVEEGLVILDSAYDLGLCGREDLRTAYVERDGWPGTAKLRVTLALAQPGSQSVGESRMRFLMWTLGLPRPRLQYPIESDGRVVAYSDFAWPDHGLLGEFDGRVKYEKFLQDGERPADVVVREKRREDEIREITGWRVIRFTWGDLSAPRRVRERMVRALRGTR